MLTKSLLSLKKRRDKTTGQTVFYSNQRRNADVGSESYDIWSKTPSTAQKIRRSDWSLITRQ